MMIYIRVLVARHSLNDKLLFFARWAAVIPDPLWYGLEGSNIYNGSGISLATLGVAPVNVRGLIPGPLNTGLYKSYTMSMDLGSVSTGYSDRPVARAIKIKHAGLNLTGRVVQLVLDAMRDTR